MIMQQVPPPSDTTIKYLQGVILETQQDANFYTLRNYVELIELATSFE